MSNIEQIHAAADAQIHDDNLAIIYGDGNENIPASTKSRGWVLTYFPLDHLMPLPPFEFATATFQSGQYEMSPTTHRLHWQGFVLFPGPLSFKAVLNKIPARADGKRGVYLEPMRGTALQAFEYTQKHDPWHDTLTVPFRWKKGEAPKSQSTLRKATKEKESYKLLCAIQEGMSLEQLTLQFPALAVKSLPNIMKLYELHAPKYKFNLPENLFEWQRQLILYLCTKPNDRTICWFYDPQGGAGKTTVIRYAMTQMNATLLNGRITDMCYAYKSQPIVFFDITRTQESNLDHLYIMAEQLKNGMLASAKYESTTKKFDPPHVVFMANSPPDTSKWTADRLHLTQLSNPTGQMQGLLGIQLPPRFDPPACMSADLIFPDIHAMLEPPSLEAVGAGAGPVMDE